MADLAVSLQLTASDDASAAIAKVRDALGEVGNAASETGKKADETRSAFDRIKDGMEEGFGLALGYAGFRDLRDIMGSTIDTVVGFNAELETMGMRLENLTGSVGGAADALQSVKDLADQSPFKFEDIESGEERLLRFNFSADEAGKLLKVAADAAAGGAGSVDSITQAFGRLNEKTDLSTRGLMGLQQAGIPVFDILAKGLNVTTAEAENLVTKGLIPTAQGIQILSDGIEQRFPNMAAKVSTSFDATVKNLQETIQFAVAQMGKPLFDVLDSAIQDALAFLKSPDVQGALTDFSQNVADTVGSVIDWFKQLGSTMSQPDVQTNLHEAWDALLDVGKSLWGLVKDFSVDLANFNTTENSTADTTLTLTQQVKLFASELRDVSQLVKDTASGFKDFGDGLNMVKSASDDLATSVHNDLITALQDALTPVQQLVDMLNEFTTLTDKVFHIKIDIPGQAGLQQFLDSIHSVQTVSGTPAATGAGGPGGIPNASAGNGSGLPAAGDIQGWAAWLQNAGVIPSDLANNPIFLSAVLTGAKGESGLNATSVQPTYIDANGRPAGGAMGLFQFDPGGMGGSPATIAAARNAGMSVQDFLTSPQGTLFEAQQIVPQYASAFRRLSGSSSGAALAAGVADSAEAPAGAWPGGAGDNNYRSNYVSPDLLTGGASGGVPYGPAPVAGGASAASTVPVDTTAIAASVGQPMVDTFDKFLRDSGTKLTGIQTTEDRSLTSAATQYGPGGTADQAAEADAAKKSAALASNKAIQEDAAQRKAAVAQEVQDDTDANNAKLAAEATVYNRQLEDQATVHSRQIEDAQIIENQQLQAQATVHQRTLQDAEILYQDGVAKQATLHAQQLQDAQIAANEQLAAQATVHSRQLQDADVVSQQGLDATAVAHSRQLQDTEAQYQLQRAISKNPGNATALEAAAADAADQLAHQRQLEDAEAVYQRGLAATALAQKRADQDTEAAYQQGLADTALAKSRADAETESQYQMGLKDVELAHQRSLQDTETAYQQQLAAQALVRSRAAQDAETAYTRGLEDKAAAHTAELQAAARAFAAQEKAKVDAVDKQLADEAYARQQQQVVDDLAAKKKSIADEYATRTAAAVQTAADARAALKASVDQSAQDQIDAATKALAGFNGAGDPVLQKMKDDWAAFDGSLATATSDVTGNQAKIQTSQAATAASATAATTAMTTAYAQSAVDISKSLGIADVAVETFANSTGATWDQARLDLNDMVTQYGVGSQQVSAAFGITDKAVETFAIDHHESWDKARIDLNAAALNATAVLGKGGTIPTAADLTTTAFDDVQKAAAKTSALDQLKTAAQELAKDGLDPATQAAKDLNTAIQEIQDKTIHVHTVFDGQQSGSGQTSSSNPVDVGSMPGAGPGGGQSTPLPGAGNKGTVGTPGNPSGTPTHPGSSGPGGIYNDPATGHPYDTGGWLPTGLSLAFNGTGSPERVLGPGESNSIDYDKLAEAMVKAMNKNGAFAVGVDQIHSALLQKARRSPLGLA